LKHYSIEVAGVKRELPVIKINDEISIASFVVLGDTELICAAAKELKEKLPEADIFVTAEAKGIPLAQELARIMDMPKYIVARKSIKSYMQNPIVRKVKSITTKDEQILCLDGIDVEYLKGKKVLLVDDVVSTGESINELKELTKEAGAEVVGKVSILTEGNDDSNSDVIALGNLPVFNN